MNNLWPQEKIKIYRYVHNYNIFTGGPNLPSFMPDYRTQFTDQMSFYERFQNFYILGITRVMEYVYYYPKHQHLIDTHFGKDYPSLYTLLSNISLTFLYTNPAMAPSLPLVSNMIPVGGIHLKKPKKLPNVSSFSLELIPRQMGLSVISVSVSVICFFW